MPTAEDEQADPKRADNVYEMCEAFLRERTRDKKLLFEENCNYGFRRNLWGMKPLGLAASGLGTAAVVLLLVQYLRSGETVDAITIVASLVNLLLLTCWIGLFTPRWVRVAADAYAEQLVAGCENL